MITALWCLQVYNLWILYLAVMNLQKARDNHRLSKLAYYLGLPALWLGLLLDFLTNMTVMTVLMLEFPRELLVTARVIRHKWDGEGYRQKLAAWLCDNLLDPFDPTGCHCKKKGS